MKIILFINQLITKVKYYGLVLKNLELYQNMWCFTRMWEFTWMVSDCEELGAHMQKNGFEENLTNYCKT